MVKKIWNDISSVSSHHTFDRRTDRQTPFSWL